MYNTTFLGFLTEADKELRDFVESIEIHYTNHKRDALLKAGRAVIMNDDFRTIQVRDLDKDGTMIICRDQEVLCGNFEIRQNMPFTNS